MPLKQTDIEALVDLFGQSAWDEMHLEIDGEELFLSTDSRARTATPTAAPVTTATAQAGPATIAHVPGIGGTTRPAAWVSVKAPNLGTFYKASAPDAAPYVTVGSIVTAETEVCLIEVMKLFTTVRAGISGVVREITMQDGQMVEYGADLLWIEPA